MQWVDVLDGMEEFLRSSGEGSGSDSAPPATVHLADLGPIPDTLRPRAQAIREATAAAERRIALRRDEVARSMQRIEQSPTPRVFEQRPPSVYVDTSV